MSTENKTLYTKAEISTDEKGMLAIASTDIEDRQGEEVDGAGWDIKNFKKNPVLQFGHRHDIPPVGIAEKIWIDKSKGKPKLMFKPKFHDITDFSRGIKRMVEEGILKAFSVGFKPLDMDGNRFTKQELLEISVVNVPANPEALMLSYKALKNDKLSEKTIGSILGDSAEIAEKLASVEAYESRIKELEKLVEHMAKENKPSEPQVDKTKMRLSALKLATGKVQEMRSESVQLPQQKRALNEKVIQRALDITIQSLKEDLHGNS